MRAAPALLVVLGLVASGCVAPGARDDLAAASLPGATSLFAWAGPELVGAPLPQTWVVDLATCVAADRCPDPVIECGPRNCERVPFEVAPPPGFAGDLLVTLRWPTDHDLWFLLDVEDPTGKVVAEGQYTYVDHLSSLARVPAPVAGTYTAVVRMAGGTASYEGAAVLAPRVDHPAGPLLPDLVTTTPTDLRIETPDAQQVGFFSILPSSPVARAAGSRGCSLDEVSSGAKRCLRFSNGIGNAGQGAVDIVLPPGSQRFVQRVWASDGSFEAHEAGAAEFHAMHAHFHNAAAGLFTVYAYSVESGVRGDVVAESRKTGICFADIALLDLRAPSADPAFHGVGCVRPESGRGIHMGISPGWFDLYDWLVADQYVEVTGVPDGTYLLCVVSNPDGVLREASMDNNEACAAFALAGDDVTVLTEEPYHKSPK